MKWRFLFFFFVRICKSRLYPRVRQGVRLVLLHGEENPLDNLLSSKSAKKAKESEVSVAPPVSGSPSFIDHLIDSEFALEDAQKLVDDWVMVLPLDARKQLAVAWFVTYRRRQGTGVTQAAQEAGSVSGFNERTV